MVYIRTLSMTVVLKSWHFAYRYGTAFLARVKTPRDSCRIESMLQQLPRDEFPRCQNWECDKMTTKHSGSLILLGLARTLQILYGEKLHCKWTRYVQQCKEILLLRRNSGPSHI